MITINTSIPSCGQTLDCFNIDIETDNYATDACGDSFIAITLKATPTNNTTFGLSLTKGADTLFDTVITFKNMPTKRTHSKIEATVEDCGKALLKTLTELDELMEHCEVSSSYDSGINQFLITVFKRCTIATFAIDTVISTSILDNSVTIASSELTLEEDFKVTAKIVECPFNNTDSYNTLVDNIDVYFDKNQEASVNLSNRIKPFLSSPVPSLTTLVEFYDSWQKKIKVVFTEVIAGVLEDAKSTAEFTVINALDSFNNCAGACNKWDINLCKDQPGFIWFYVKYIDGVTANYIKGYDENDTELFSYDLDAPESGLYSVNVSYGYLVPNGHIPSGTTFVRIEIVSNDSDIPFDVEVNYICDCEKMESFLFLTDSGVFESIQLRLHENKLKVKKELYTSAIQCAEQKKVFAVDIENTFTMVTPRIEYSDRDKWKEFLSSKEIYWLTYGELLRVTDEGGSIGFKENSLTEINVEFNG